MIASRITKAFQLTALVLAFAVLNVYVMASPVRTPTDSRTTDASATQPKSEKVVAEKQSDKTAGAETQATAEKMPLTAGTKSVLTRIFSKRDVEARAAATNSFLGTKTNFAETFKSPAKNAANAQTSGQTSGQTSNDDSDHSGRRSTWVAVGIIAAVVTVAVIGLRHDRNNGN